MKVITLFFLFFFTSQLFAEWKKIGDNSLVTYFVETSMIVPHLEGRRMAKELHEFKTPLEDGTTSLRIRSEFDCKLKKVRNLTSDKIAGELGVGKIVSVQDTPTPWKKLTSDSLRSEILKFVCK